MIQFGSFLFLDAPIFIYIHGGYWQLANIDKTNSAYVVEPLYKAGHKVIVLDYDICPNITLEQLVDQVQRAGISTIIIYGGFVILLKLIWFCSHCSSSC